MCKIVQYLLTCCLIILSACKSKDKDLEKVLSIREMGALATTQYTMTKMVKASDDKTWYKLGDRKILISVEATVKAGIDLTALKKEDIQINGSAIRLLLPPPQVLTTNISPEKIKLEYEEVGPLRSEFAAADRMQLLQQAERQIRDAIPETGMLETNRRHTREWITRFCLQLGFEEVEVDFTDLTPKSKLQ